MKHVVTKFVSWLQSLERKDFSAKVTYNLFQMINSDPDFFKKLIARDESRVYGYDPETKAIITVELIWVSTPENSVAMLRPC